MRPLAALALAALVAGCAVPSQTNLSGRPDLASRAVVDDVPLIEQADFYCGPASLAMVLQWAGRDVTQEELASQAFTPGAEGTYLADMLGTARRQGMLAVELNSMADLLAEVEAGHPVIAFQNLGLGWLPRWHYAVVTGYDLPAREITMHSGELSRLTMDFSLFERTWRRGDYWAITLLPPGDMPVSARESEVLSAAAALERVGQYAAAETAYRAGAARWPDSWLWQFGLANARYGQGDLAGAEAALRAAARIAPDVPEIRQNLATLRAERARRG